MNMKIVMIGATGTIGSAVAKELVERHDIVKVGGTGGDVQVDMTSLDSIRQMYKKLGKLMPSFPPQEMLTLVPWIN